jgi:hypothetical protein
MSFKVFFFSFLNSKTCSDLFLLGLKGLILNGLKVNKKKESYKNMGNFGASC